MQVLLDLSWIQVFDFCVFFFTFVCVPHSGVLFVKCPQNPKQKKTKESECEPLPVMANVTLTDLNETVTKALKNENKLNDDSKNDKTEETIVMRRKELSIVVLPKYRRHHLATGFVFPFFCVYVCVFLKLGFLAWVVFFFQCFFF